MCIFKVNINRSQTYKTKWDNEKQIDSKVDKNIRQRYMKRDVKTFPLSVLSTRPSVVFNTKLEVAITTSHQRRVSYSDKKDL